MSAKTMYDLKETLCENLDQYAKKDALTRNDLDTVHMLTDTIKNIDKISTMEEEGYSYGEGNWNANGSYSNGMRMNDDMMYSGRRGRRSGAGGYMGNNYSGNDDMESRMRREMY